MTDLAQVAYTAYGASVGWTAHDGGDMPSYGALPAPIAAGWKAAAEAVLDLHRSERDLMLADLGDLLRAVGLFDGAQDRTPHDLMQRAIGEVRRRLTSSAEVDVAPANVHCSRCGQRLNQEPIRDGQMFILGVHECGMT